MDFIRYAEGAAALLNADLAGADAQAVLGDLVATRHHLAPVTPADVDELRAFQAALRPVFSEPGAADTASCINTLMQQHPVTPFISDHEPGRPHLHVASRTGTVADQLVSEALLGLANVVCDLGAGRLGECSARGCDRVYVDTSPNSSRRYCSERCSSRANVAAYRARQRARQHEPAEAGGHP